MFPIPKQCILTELQEDVIQHVSLLPGNTLCDVHTVPGQALEGKVLGTAPGLDADTSHTGKISNHEGVNAIILSNVIKGFLIVPDFLWIETVNPDGEWGQQLTGR